MVMHQGSGLSLFLFALLVDVTEFARGCANWVAAC